MKGSNLKFFFMGVFVVASGLSVLAAVNLPNTFAPSTPIKASEVNANFAALKGAIDTLQAGGLALPTAVEGASPDTGTALLKISTTDIGSAIYGISNDSSSAAVGVQGDTSSPGGFGVYGLARVDGIGTGVYGQGGVGVWGRTTAKTDKGYGVYGESTSGTGYGVFGKWVSGTAGVYGETGNQNSAAVLTTRGSGVSALIVNQWGSGNIMGRDSNNAEVFRVTNAGDVQVRGVTLTSDRNAKANFKTVDAGEVLEQVARLPISQWNYKNDSSQIAHIGPMAQDFHAAFGLNGDDDKHINAVDAQGVALAAIQGLNQKLEAKNKQIAQLETTLAQLEARLSKLEQR